MPDTPMLSRPIPSTGELMPVIGLGTWAVFDVNAGAGVEGRSDRMREPTMVAVRANQRVYRRAPVGRLLLTDRCGRDALFTCGRDALFTIVEMSSRCKADKS